MTDHRRVKKLLVSIAEETTRGTYNDPSSSICMFNVDVPQLDTQLNELNCANGTLQESTTSIIPGYSTLTGGFSLPYPLDKVPDMTSFMAAMTPVFKASGLEVKDYGANDKITTPDDLTASRRSLKYTYDGFTYKVRGVVITSVEFLFEAGKPCMVNYQWKGVLHDLDEATPTENTTNPTTLNITPCKADEITNSFTDGTNTYRGCVYKCSVKIENEVQPVESIGAEDGLKFFVITDRSYTIEMASTSVYNTVTLADAVGDVFTNYYKAGKPVTLKLEDGSSNLYVQAQMLFKNMQITDNSGLLGFVFTAAGVKNPNGADLDLAINYIEE